MPRHLAGVVAHDVSHKLRQSCLRILSLACPATMGRKVMRYGRLASQGVGFVDLLPFGGRKALTE